MWGNQKFGVREQEVHGALLSGDPHDQLAIAYHLIVDNKRIADEAAKAELRGSSFLSADLFLFRSKKNRAWP